LVRSELAVPPLPGAPLNNHPHLQDKTLTPGSCRFTKEEFEDLCFEFGIELDEDTEEDERPEGVPPELKIGQSWSNHHFARCGF
jgi:hypothetical protein